MPQLFAPHRTVWRIISFVYLIYTFSCYTRAGSRWLAGRRRRPQLFAVCRVRFSMVFGTDHRITEQTFEFSENEFIDLIERDTRALCVLLAFVWAISVCLSSHAVNTQQTAVEFFIFDRNAMFVVLFARAFASLNPIYEFYSDCKVIPFLLRLYIFRTVHICVLLLDPAVIERWVCVCVLARTTALEYESHSRFQYCPHWIIKWANSLGVVSGMVTVLLQKRNEIFLGQLNVYSSLIEWGKWKIRLSIDRNEFTFGNLLNWDSNDVNRAEHCFLLSSFLSLPLKLTLTQPCSFAMRYTISSMQTNWQQQRISHLMQQITQILVQSNTNNW